MHAPAALLLALVAAGAGLLIGLVGETTAPRIHENRQARLLATLESLLPGGHDNNPALAAVPIEAPGALQTRAPVTAYLATRDGALQAAVFALTTHDGYAGDIDLLVALAADGTLLGVRSPRHRETPGIGDVVLRDDADWLAQFNGADTDLDAHRARSEVPWAEQFDGVTGATITTRAVTDAVARVGAWFQAHRDVLVASAQAAAP
jgi:electron transport complex protein RnfG